MTSSAAQDTPSSPPETRGGPAKASRSQIDFIEPAGYDSLDGEVCGEELVGLVVLVPVM